MNEEQLASFRANGFVKIPKMASQARVTEIRAAVDAALSPALAPVEYEAQVGYAGAPDTLDAPGGKTPRRLLHAFTRDEVFRRWGRDPRVVTALQSLLGHSRVMLSQNHHNCVMTKHAAYSSKTAWHRDVRYWSFDRPELISMWLALGPERVENGALKVIPGSHTVKYGRGNYDANLFFREDLPENRAAIATAQDVPMDAGDVLFFDALTLHAAGANQTGLTKYSLVYTYHRDDNRPIPGTQSARFDDIPLW